MDRLPRLKVLPAPTLPPRLPATCPTTHEPGYTPLNAIEWGCPTMPTFTQGLQREDQRKRLIIYMVRYNFIGKRMAAIISNTGTSKKEFTADCDYYERVRKDLQSLAIGNAITSDKTPSWFIRYVLFVLTQDNFQIHLYNLRLLIVHDEVVPANESLGSKERRLSNLTRCQNLYDSHKARWVNSLKEQIGKENAAMDLIPPNSPANLVKMHQIQKYITRLQCKYSIL